MKFHHYLTSIVLLVAANFATALPSGLLAKPDTWFDSAEGRETTAGILSWQSLQGSWPKNQDNSRKLFSGDRKNIKGTFDNGATTDELRYLARAFRATKDKACGEAFLLGFDHVIKAQYPNGGWPQYFPPGKKYHRHITFNDNTIVRLLVFLREVSEGDDYQFVGGEKRRSAQDAYDRGIACILNCQIVVKGVPTVWCAQHDEVTLAPVAARAYELPSLSGSESAGILRFLTSIEKPSPAVIKAVRAGAAWFESTRINGMRIEKNNGELQVIEDPKADPVWARFRDIETNQAFFCGRDGVKKFKLSEIDKERRNGYAWYGNWGKAVASAYAKWPYH